jgi:ribosome-binding factor A
MPKRPQQPPCDNLHDDDGWLANRPPSGRASSNHNPRRAARKQAQLGAQVQQSIDLTLGADLDDLDLQGLRVLDIQPLQGDAHLLIRVAPSPGSPPQDLTALQLRLTQNTPFLRAQVASDIHRKKTPRLSFLVLPPPEDAPNFLTPSLDTESSEPPPAPPAQGT